MFTIEFKAIITYELQHLQTQFAVKSLIYTVVWSYGLGGNKSSYAYSYGS